MAGDGNGGNPGRTLHFSPGPEQTGDFARDVSAQLAGDDAPMVRVTAAWSGDRIGLEWVAAAGTCRMYFSAAEARSVAAELLASADEAEGLARLEAELAPAIAELNAATQALVADLHGMPAPDPESTP